MQKETEGEEEERAGEKWKSEPTSSSPTPLTSSSGSRSPTVRATTTATSKDGKKRRFTSNYKREQRFLINKGVAMLEQIEDPRLYSELLGKVCWAMKEYQKLHGLPGYSKGHGLSAAITKAAKSVEKAVEKEDRGENKAFEEP